MKALADLLDTLLPWAVAAMIAAVIFFFVLALALVLVGCAPDHRSDNQPLCTERTTAERRAYLDKLLQRGEYRCTTEDGGPYVPVCEAPTWTHLRCYESASLWKRTATAEGKCRECFQNWAWSMP